MCSDPFVDVDIFISYRSVTVYDAIGRHGEAESVHQRALTMSAPVLTTNIRETLLGHARWGQRVTARSRQVQHIPDDSPEISGPSEHVANASGR
jgi:hypothetical protein